MAGAASPSASKAQAASSVSDQLDALLEPDSNRIEELSSEELVEVSDQDSSSDNEADGNHVHGWLGARAAQNSTPSFFLHPHILQDELSTDTSEKIAAVTKKCLPLLSGAEPEIHELNSYGLPKLQRAKHIKFLHGVLGQYPPPFQVMDASRPWLLYWALCGLATLGEDVSRFKQRCMETFGPLQNKSGGFGGGHGQTSHCAASYAAVLSLALVGGLDLVDRKSMWEWMGQVKQADGGFAMAVGGEEDVRGAYCSMTIHTLLALPLSLPSSAPARSAGAGLTSFTSSLPQWLSRCQTFEGGIAGAPTNEAHGAYAFCGLACLALLGPPQKMLNTYLDVPQLLHWLSARQCVPEGGFQGRTGKLVDACYSHWVGGCWAILEAALLPLEQSHHTKAPEDEQSGGGGLPPAEPRSKERQSLWSREGLVRYTLACSQTKKGGLRDKPGTRPDGYHTCYSLAGLSAAQNIYTYIPAASDTDVPVGDAVEAPLTSAYNWKAERATLEQRKEWRFDESDTVGFVHPVFVLPMDVVERTRRQFDGVVGF